MSSPLRYVSLWCFRVRARRFILFYIFSGPAGGHWLAWKVPRQIVDSTMTQRSSCACTRRQGGRSLLPRRVWFLCLVPFVPFVPLVALVVWCLCLFPGSLMSDRYHSSRGRGDDRDRSHRPSCHSLWLTVFAAILRLDEGLIGVFNRGGNLFLL